MMHLRFCALVLVLLLGLPSFGLSEDCEAVAEPWQSVRSAWQASWDMPLSVELHERAQMASTQAGLPPDAVERLQWLSWRQASAQILALASVLVLLLSWPSIRRKGWRIPLLAFGLAAISLGLGYVELGDPRILMRQADVRTSPSGAAAVVDQVSMGQVGQCTPSSVDPAFCFWHAAAGAQGWVETRIALPISASCHEH